jgi:small nuclear ribonucleoprotein (snRNP)-like protein
MSRRDRTPKTLVVVLRSMMDMEFVIEMKNDTEVRGILDNVDDGMKYVHMHNSMLDL